MDFQNSWKELPFLIDLVDWKFLLPAQTRYILFPFVTGAVAVSEGWSDHCHSSSFRKKKDYL